ncbi:MAG: hypothetical protein AAGF11_00300 [Myxococcota bacterium]
MSHGSSFVQSSLVRFCVLAGFLGGAVGQSACVVEDDPELREAVWIGPEQGANELVPDLEPNYLDEQEAQDVFGALDQEEVDVYGPFGEELDDLVAEPDLQLASWTQWYDRDNPSGNGDYENRSLQAGVCASPSGVECRTVSGLALWQTGEVVTCSTNAGFICVNADQPDGDCDYDYKVRFLCPDACVPATCGFGDCGIISDGCGGIINCGPCNPTCIIGYCSDGSCCGPLGQCNNGGPCLYL